MSSILSKSFAPNKKVIPIEIVDLIGRFSGNPDFRGRYGMQPTVKSRLLQKQVKDLLFVIDKIMPKLYKKGKPSADKEFVKTLIKLHNIYDFSNKDRQDVLMWIIIFGNDRFYTSKSTGGHNYFKLFMSKKQHKLAQDLNKHLFKKLIDLMSFSDLNKKFDNPPGIGRGGRRRYIPFRIKNDKLEYDLYPLKKPTTEEFVLQHEKSDIKYQCLIIPKLSRSSSK